MLGELFKPKRGEQSAGEILRTTLMLEDSDLDKGIRRILLNVLGIEDRIIREIMVPRIDMITLNENDSRETVIETVGKYGHSRIPVISGDADDVVGILYAKDLLTAKKSVPLKNLCREVFFVPETKPVLDLLDDFRSRRIHIAIVVDEYGGVSGLVSLEDVLELLVGDILDEYDDEEEAIRKSPRGGWSVDAREPVHSVNRVCATEFPEDQADTLGGLFMELYGSLPVKGDHVVSEGYRITVLRVRDNRIDRLAVRKERRPRSG